MKLAWFSGEEVASGSDRGSERVCADSNRSGKSSPDHVINVMTEMFVSEENLNKMEDILDTWSNNLKVYIYYQMSCHDLQVQCLVLIPTVSWEFIRYTCLVCCTRML